jgi:microcystin-dependent protein
MTDKVTLTNKSSNLYINNYGFLVPTGTIVCYAGSTAPDGWLFCDGQTLPKTTYANLHNVIQYNYGGSGDNFNLPDLKERFPMGKSNNTNINTNTLGVTGGANSVTLTSDKLPLHTHTALSTSAGSHSHTGSISDAGNHSHTITDPGHKHSHNAPGGPGGPGLAFKTGRNTATGLDDDAGSGNELNLVNTEDLVINNATTGITIGITGAHSHSLTIGVTGAHSHDITVSPAGVTGPSINVTNPYIVLNYIIRY